ncbi:MAG: hypothetical protein EB115_12595 [Betaproteobacteria bacterium]|nr:hypothetical protein [Betaproteobacteria bacterium]
MASTDILSILNRTFVKVENLDDHCVRFTAADGYMVEMFHSQECCEDVYLEDVVGDLSDLENSEIVRAEKTDREIEDSEYGIKGWTFYNISTVKGSVTLRWCGSSNGYYSVDVGVYANTAGIPAWEG